MYATDVGAWAKFLPAHMKERLANPSTTAIRDGFKMLAGVVREGLGLVGLASHICECEDAEERERVLEDLRLFRKGVSHE